MQADMLKKRIMRRVYAIWFVRRALPMIGGVVFSLTVAFKMIADSFFVAEIIKNFKYVLAHNLMGLPRYIESALNSAEPSTLILISMAGIIGFALSVKLLRSVRSIMWGGVVSASYIKR